MSLKSAITYWIKKGSIPFFIQFILIFPQKISAQETVKGFIYSESNQPLHFCSLVYLHQNKGTYTDSLGQFFLTNNNLSQLNDSIYISYIGYEAKKISLKTFKNGDTVFLKKQTYNLKEIQIRPKELELLKFKNKGHSRELFSGSANSVMAYYINHNHGGYLKKVSFFLRANSSNSYTSLRVLKKTSVYSDQTHLLDTNLLVKLKKGNRKVTFDLAKFNIKIPEDGLLVGLEFIKNPSYKEFGGKNRFSLKLNDKIKESNTYIGIPGKKWIPYPPNYEDGKARNVLIKYEILVEKE